MAKGILFDFYRTLYNPDENHLNDNAIPLLDELKRENFQLGLLSRKGDFDRDSLISKLGLTKYFQKIKFVDDTKTADDIQDFLDSFSLTAKEVVLVGDRVKSEIKAGNQAGILTIWYRNGKFANEFPESLDEKPNYIITDLMQVLDAV